MEVVCSRRKIVFREETSSTHYFQVMRRRFANAKASPALTKSMYTDAWSTNVAAELTFVKRNSQNTSIARFSTTKKLPNRTRPNVKEDLILL